MFYVYFTRNYSNEEMIAETLSHSAALARADEELANGSSDIVVVTETGQFVYEPEPDEEEFLVDEL